MKKLDQLVEICVFYVVFFFFFLLGIGMWGLGYCV